jgi:hypothetical protein
LAALFLCCSQFSFNPPKALKGAAVRLVIIKCLSAHCFDDADFHVDGGTRPAVLFPFFLVFFQILKFDAAYDPAVRDFIEVALNNFLAVAGCQFLDGFLFKIPIGKFGKGHELRRYLLQNAGALDLFSPDASPPRPGALQWRSPQVSGAASPQAGDSSPNT